MTQPSRPAVEVVNEFLCSSEKGLSLAWNKEWSLDCGFDLFLDFQDKR